MAPHILRRHGKGRPRRTMPLVCLVLALLVTWQFLSERREEHEGYSSVSIQDREFVWDHCKNMTFLPYKPANSNFGRFESQGIHGFVFVSSYRLSAMSFAVLGLTPGFLRPQWGSFQEACLWVSFSGPELTAGKLEYRFLSSQSQSFDYDVVVITCTLTDSTTKAAGGALLINILGIDELAVYREDPGPRDLNPQAPYKHTLTMCSTVMSAREAGKLHANRTVEHLLYVKFFGASHFVVYDGGGAGPALRSAVSPFSKAGALEIVDFRELRKLSVDADAVAMNDCALRSRFKSEWAVMLSYEEYPTMGDEERLRKLLQVNAGRPWMSVGVQIWDTTMCIKTGDQSMLLVEKMVFRRPKAFCTNTTADPHMCLGNDGIRRLIFDPRKTGLLSPHFAVFPTARGVDLNTTQMRINKFVGLASPAALTCEYPVADNHHSDRWDRDKTISKLIKQGKQSGQMAYPD